jgi:methyl-accepting chemotaxis protein/aerotaxis receptor
VGDAMRASADAKDVIGTMTGNISSIQSVVDLIRSIAGQTNMLALNAMIEAARAGEAGRGFAVVSDEVKDLAQKTTRSTQSIVNAIGAIEASNQDVVRAVDRMADSVAAIDQIAKGIADAVEEQRQVIANIASHVDATVQAAAALSEQITAMTSDVGSSFECAAEVYMAANVVAEVTEGLVATFKESVSHAVRTSASEVNRRRSERISVEVPCRIRLGQAELLDGTTTDLSAHGARVALPERTDVHTGMRGAITLPGRIGLGTGPMGFTVANIKTADGRMALGLSFDQPMPQAAALHGIAA